MCEHSKKEDKNIYLELWHQLWLKNNIKNILSKKTAKLLIQYFALLKNKENWKLKIKTISAGSVNLKNKQKIKEKPLIYVIYSLVWFQ